MRDREDAIAKLGEELAAWFEAGLSPLGLPAGVPHGRASDRALRIFRQVQRLKRLGLKAIRKRLTGIHSTPEDRQVASLIETFAFSARLAATLHDELLDTNGANKIVLLMNEVAAALDATSQGRSALGELLSHSNPRVRASAGAYLLIKNLLPERVVPVLRAIDERNEGNRADFTAHWALLDWELKQKATGG
jgi:hypothetical protein